MCTDFTSRTYYDINNKQLMRWIQGFINPRILYLQRPDAEANILFLG